MQTIVEILQTMTGLTSRRSFKREKLLLAFWSTFADVDHVCFTEVISMDIFTL